MTLPFPISTQLRVSGLETQVLRETADDRAVTNLVLRAEPNCAFDHGMRSHDRVRADLRLAADAGVGPDFHVFAQLRAGLDNCGRMNLHSTPISLKLK